MAEVNGESFLSKSKNDYSNSKRETFQRKEKAMEDNSLIFGFEGPSRSLCPVQANTETVRFLVTSQKPKFLTLSLVMNLRVI